MINGMVSMGFDPEDLADDGMPRSVRVSLGHRSMTYGRERDGCTLSNHRNVKCKVTLAECSECGSETYVDELSAFCCSCGAAIKRGELGAGS